MNQEESVPMDLTKEVFDAIQFNHWETAKNAARRLSKLPEYDWRTSRCCEFDIKKHLLEARELANNPEHLDS
jgi:hypothetical protein